MHIFIHMYTHTLSFLQKLAFTVLGRLSCGCLLYRCSNAMFWIDYGKAC